MIPTIEQLNAGIARARAEGYTVFVSLCGKTVSVSLRKYRIGDSQFAMDVKGEGDTVEAAFAVCFANFPKNPLDGAGAFATDRLTGPITEGEFTEIPDATS